MLSWLLNLRWIALAVALTGAGAFSAGYVVKTKFCNAAAAKAEVATLRAHIAALEEAYKRHEEMLADDVKAAEADAELIRALEEKADALEAKVGSGACLDSGAVDGLREYFDQSGD